VLMTKPNANVKKRCIFLDFDSFTIAGAPHPLGNQWSNGYVAPEQVNNSSYIHTQESDIYKIAIVAIRMLTQTCDYPSYSFGIETVDPSRQALLFLGGHKLYEFMDRALSDNPLLRPTSEVLSSTWTNYLTLRKLKI
jgi:serine/threonine protein kinase